VKVVDDLARATVTDVIPPSDLDRVLAEAHSIEADDARYRAEIAREDGPPP
jgi:hypothetical protein